MSCDGNKEEDKPLVCVLCGRPWIPAVKNVCECGGFCSWGEKKDGEPSSWTVTKKGWIPKPVPKESFHLGIFKCKKCANVSYKTGAFGDKCPKCGKYHIHWISILIPMLGGTLGGILYQIFKHGL